MIFASPVVAAAERAALLEQRRPGGAVDRAVDPAAAEQARVGGVDDRVRFGVRGDVAEMQGDQGMAAALPMRAEGLEPPRLAATRT